MYEYCDIISFIRTQNFSERLGFVLRLQELEDLRRETQSLIDGARDKVGDPDYWFNDEIPDKWCAQLLANNGIKSCSVYDMLHRYNVETKPGSITEKESVRRGVPFRVEYPIDKARSTII
jgi:hypothetical protein